MVRIKISSICVLLIVIFTIFGRLDTASALGTYATLNGAPLVVPTSTSQLGTIVGFIDAGAVTSTSVLSIKLPENFEFPDNLEAYNSTSPHSQSGYTEFFYAPTMQGDTNALDGVTFSIAKVEGSDNEITIKPNTTPNPCQNGYFYLYLKGIEVPSGASGDVAATLSSNSGWGYGSVVVAKAGDPEVDISLDTVDVIDSENTSIGSIRIWESIAGAIKPSANSIKFTLPAGYSFSNTGSIHSIWGSLPGGLTVHNQSDGGRSLTLSVSSPTLNKSCFQITGLDLAVDDTLAQPGDIIASLSGDTNIHQSTLVIAESTAPSITLGSPSAGTYWTAGTTLDIDWIYTGDVDTIDIELLSNGAIIQTIDTGIASSDKSYSWEIPYTLATGTYQIKLMSTSDSSVSATSSSFTIAAPNGSITISNPSEGNTWITDTKQTIRWTYTGAVKKVNIQLFKDGELYKSIAGTTASKKKYSWKIPTTIENGTYRVKIFSTTDNTIYGTSNEFTISQPVTSVTLTNPSGEASWEPGSKQTIKWSYDGKINKVNIQLMQDGDLVKTIVSASAKKKSYKWTVPDNLDGTYQIKIANAANEEVYDTSGDITIEAPEVTLNLTSPAEDATWKLKKKQIIKWSYTGMPGKVTVSLYKGDTLIKQIGSYACKKNKTSGSCKFTPKNLDLGDDYYIVISSTIQQDVTDESGEFSIK